MINRMDHKEYLTPFIRAHLQYGTSADSIRQQLVDNGWNTSVVEEAMHEILQTTTPQPRDDAIPEMLNQPVLPEVYGLREAFPEAYKAIRANISAVAILSFIGMIVPVLVYIGAIYVSLASVININEGQYPSPGQDGEVYLYSKILPMFVIAALVMTVFSAYTQIATSLSINSSVDSKKADIKVTALTALKRMPRLLLVSLTFSLFVGAPILIFAMITLSIGMLAQGFSVITYILGPVAIGLTSYLSLRYALMPVIAIFEPKLNIKQLFRRTKHLMSIGGSLFYFKLALVGFAISMSVSYLSSLTGTAVSVIPLLLNIIVLITFPIFTTAISVVFYRNRLIARG